MVKIITDSTCDLTKEEIEALHLTVVPLTVLFGAQAFVDGVDLNKDQFYEKLEKCAELPTTSQPSPEDFEKCFRESTADGSEAVALFLSSSFSGTYQNARAAAQEVAPDKIFLIDTPSSSFGTSLIIRMASKYRDAGDSAMTIALKCARLCERLRLFATVSTLKYLRMGGRLSDTATLIGGALNLRLNVEVKDGKIRMQGISRGEKNALRSILSRTEKEAPDFSLPVCFGHSHAPHLVEKLKDVFGNYIPAGTEVVSGELGSVIGTHVGPNMAAFAYFAKE